MMQPECGSIVNLVPPPGRRHNRAAILEATRMLLRTKGPDSLTMDEVARAARVARRTIYNHFADMQELFEQSHRALLAQLAPLVPAPIAAQMAPRQALTRFVHQAVRLFDDAGHGDLQISLVRDREGQAWLAQAYEMQITRPLTERLAQYLATLPGAAGPDATAEIIRARQLVALLQAFALSRSIFGLAITAMPLPIAGIVDTLIPDIAGHASEAA